MKVIMVGVDGSTGADVAVRHAVDLGQLCDAGVFAVAVRPDPGHGEAEPSDRDVERVAAEEAVSAAAEGWFEAALNKCAEACAVAEVQFAQATVVGDPVQELTQQSESCDLLVVGAHGQTNDPTVLLGGTTRRLLRSCIKPMLVTRAEHRAVERVLIGYDGSPASGHALELAADLAAAGGWEVAVATGAPEQSELAEGVHRAAKLVAARGLEPEVRVMEGDAPGILFEEAKRLNADLIAIGRARRGMLTGFFFGESWPDLVEQASAPVLLWR